MNTNIKSNKTLLVSILAVLLAALLTFSLVGCNSSQEPTDKAQTEGGITNDFAAEIENTQFVRLAMSSVSTLAENGSVSKEITATVLPATATNKAVDWSVEWGDGSNTATVTDYVTVTPDSDGSTHAVVTCHKAFTGNILVTVTTRESGYTANCMVSFAGMPTDMSLNGNVSLSGDAYKVGIGQTYTFDVALSNPFGSVGSQFNNMSCSVTGVGSINVGYMEHYNSSGADKWYETSNKVLTIDSIKDSFITASYANGQLTITTLKSFGSYYSAKVRLDSGRTWGYEDKFRSYVDDCYFSVTLQEANSGISKTVKIRFDEAVVTGVNASVTEMVF